MWNTLQNVRACLPPVFLVAYYTYTFKATNHAILDTAYCAYYIPSNMVVIM